MAVARRGGVVSVCSVLATLTRKKAIKISCLLALIPTGISASDPASTHFPLEWQQVDMAAVGISGSAVTALTVNRDGSVWVGTHRGLAVFSNHEWRLFAAESSPLPDNDILQLAATLSGEMCVRTNDAVSVVFGTDWNTADVLQLGQPHGMTVGADGSLWVLGQVGESYSNEYRVAHFENKHWSYYPFSFPDRMTSSYGILVNKVGTIWAGTFDGIYELDLSKATAHRVSGLESLNSRYIEAMAVDKSGATWIGTSKSNSEIPELWAYASGKLRRFDQSNSLLPMGKVSQIVADPDGSTWVLTDKALQFTGLLLLDIRKGEFGVTHIKQDGTWEVMTPLNSSLPNQSINAIASNSTGLWLGTDVGLMRGQRSRWNVADIHQRVDVGEEVLDLKIAQNRSVWCLTNYALRILPENGEPIVALKIPSVGDIGGTAMTMSSDKRVFWVLFAENLFRIDIDKPTSPLKVPIEIQNGSNQQALLAVDQDTIILGQTAHLLRVTYKAGMEKAKVETLDLNAPEFVSNSSSSLDANLFSDSLITHMAQDSASGKFAVGGPNGLSICGSNQCKYYGAKEMGSKNRGTYVNSLNFAKDGSLWAGLSFGLVHILVDGKAVLYKSASVSVAAVAKDQSVWIGTTNGLEHFNEMTNSREIYDGGNSKVVGQVRFIDFDPEGNLWLAGRQNGVAHFRIPDTRPEVLSLLNAVKQFRTREQAFGVVPFDPSFETRPESFRYHWTITTFLGKAVRDQLGSTPFETFKLEDGFYSLSVVAIDRYGIQSKPFIHSFEVSVPSDNPWVSALKKLVTSGFALYALSFLGLIVMIPFYHRYGWVRTAINSGVFSKYSLLHKTLLNTSWARRFIFRSTVKLLSSNAVLPDQYIAQTLSYGLDNSVSISIDEPENCLKSIFRDAKSAMIVGRSGSGKSVLLHRLLIERSQSFLCHETNEMPLLINMRTDWSKGQTISSTIKSVVSGEGVELPLDVVEFFVAKGGFLILIDSLNEVDTASGGEVLNTFLTSNSRNRVLIASQIDTLQRAQTRVLAIDVIGEGEARKYVASRVGTDIWELLPEEAKKLAENPQNLEMLCEALTATNCSEIPLRRADLYRSIMENDSALKPIAGTDDMAAVYKLAATMFEELRYSLRPDEAIELLKGVASNPAVVLQVVRKSRAFKEEIKRNKSGISEAALSFFHESIGKYLAARHLKVVLQSKSETDADKLRTLAAEERFEDVFKFIVDELDSRTWISRLLTILLEKPERIHLSICAYAIGTKRPELVEKRLIELYTEAQVRVQAGLASIQDHFRNVT